MAGKAGDSFKNSQEARQLRAIMEVGKRRVPTWPIFLVVGGVTAIATLYQSLFTVPPSHRAVIFNKFAGTRDFVFDEGTHVKIPYIEDPIIFDIRPEPAMIHSTTGTFDLQMVEVDLRVLPKPSIPHLPQIYKDLGRDYNDRVLPSIVNEVCKAVIARYSASDLLAKREAVSQEIKATMTDRARDFHIILEDVSITNLQFGTDFRMAVESKQVAQQDAERAKFLVERAKQEKLGAIIKATGEAEAAQMIGKAVAQNPSFLKIRRLEAIREIAQTIAVSKNRVMLSSDTLLLDALTEELKQTEARGSK